MKTAKQYTEDLFQALQLNYENTIKGIYEGKKGALRLAQEYGYGLKDYDKKERKDAIQSSYSILCVRAYYLKPPIDEKEWAQH